MLTSLNPSFIYHHRRHLTPVISQLNDHSTARTYAATRPVLLILPASIQKSRTPCISHAPPRLLSHPLQVLSIGTQSVPGYYRLLSCTPQTLWLSETSKWKLSFCRFGYHITLAKIQNIQLIYKNNYNYFRKILLTFVQSFKKGGIQGVQVSRCPNTPPKTTI